MPEGIRVEIGPGEFPLGFLRDDLQPGTQLFIDRDETIFEELEEQVGQGKSIQGDVANLPLADSSVNGVVLMNVFGQEGILERKKGKLTGKKIHVGDVGRIAQELRRVCRPQGNVVVIETATPPEKEQLIEKFKSAGFTLAETYTKDEHNLAKIFSTDPNLRYKVNAVIEVADTTSYALVFKIHPFPSLSSILVTNPRSSEIL